jgi:electron transfer flavoprotein alpha subunit
MNLLVFSERHDIGFELLAKGREVFPDAEISAALITSDQSSKAEDYFSHGADIVYQLREGGPEITRPDVHATILRKIVESDSIKTVLIGSTRQGKQTASTLAQMLNCGCVTDALDLRNEGDALHADRYALAGNTVATVAVTSKERVIAIMPHSSKPSEKTYRTGVVKEIESSPSHPQYPKTVQRSEKKGEQVNLEDAKVIVGVGKGFAKQEDVEIAQELAYVLKAELGCTRPVAVDNKWLAEERSIGLSSKKVAPELYVAVGISGQIQHVVGVMNARTIVAINKSEDAPIFDVSDYGLVGDLYRVLPLLSAELKKVMIR